jgi:carbonic anhydrase
MNISMLQRASGKSVSLVVYAAALSLMYATAGHAQAWNHDPDSSIGPNHWGFLHDTYNSYATCGTSDKEGMLKVEVGKKQTPVNLITTAVTASAELKDIDFEYSDTPFHIINTGHYVEVEYELGHGAIEVGNSLPDGYSLQQFHFHAPSEHEINGQLVDAEMHLVHQNALGELAVVAVMLIVDDANANPLFDQIIFNAPAAGTDVEVGGEVNAKDLLPTNRRYYTYTGSLTTPPCSEGVHWFVMAEPVKISSAALKQFHTIIGQFPGYNGFSKNNRPVRPLNGRSVFTSIADE